MRQTRGHAAAMAAPASLRAPALCCQAMRPAACCCCCCHCWCRADRQAAHWGAWTRQPRAAALRRREARTPRASWGCEAAAWRGAGHTAGQQRTPACRGSAAVSAAVLAPLGLGKAARAPGGAPCPSPARAASQRHRLRCCLPARAAAGTVAAPAGAACNPEAPGRVMPSRPRVQPPGADAPFCHPDAAALPPAPCAPLRQRLLPPPSAGPARAASHKAGWQKARPPRARGASRCEQGWRQG